MKSHRHLHKNFNRTTIKFEKYINLHIKANKYNKLYTLAKKIIIISITKKKKGKTNRFFFKFIKKIS